MTATETEEKKAPPPEPMLEFKFPPTENGQVDARTLMRWCTHKPLLEAVEEHRFHDPRLLIVVRGPRELRDGRYSDTEWEDTAVYCVPLTAEMHYVYFHRPGINEVRAVVVDYAHKQTRKWVRQQLDIPRERLSGLFPGHFRSLFSDYSDRFETHTDDYVKFFVTDVVEKVNVPATLFAAEPSPWKKKFTSIYYRGKAYDECDFRSRVIGSFFRAGFYSTFGTALRLFLLAFGTVLGLRGMKPQKLLAPWRPHPQRILTDDTTIWIMDSQGMFRLSPLNLINPIVLSVLPAIAFGIANIHHGKSPHRVKTWDTSWWHCVAWIDGVIVGLVALVLLVIGLVLAAGWLAAVASNSQLLKDSQLVKFLNARLAAFSSYWQQKGEQRYQARKQREQDHQLNLQAQLAAMTCRLEASEVSIAALPKEKQTLTLRVQELKLKVCRPFAQ